MAVFAALLCAFAADGSAREACERDRIHLTTATGTVSFELELALTPDEQARGLMFRTELAPDRGMLFVYDPPRRALFWMKNTLIPLDMIFIRDDGTVESIAAMTTPESTETIPSEGRVRAVLEIAGGRAEAVGIEPGTEAIHPAFEAAPGADLCPPLG